MNLDTGKYLLYLAILAAWAVYIMSLRGTSYKKIFIVNVSAFVGIVISYLMMIQVLLSRDYNVIMVYNYTSEAMTNFERVSAAWVARAPIMTLWGLYMLMISVFTMKFMKSEFEDPVVQNMMKIVFFFGALIASFAVSARPGAFDKFDMQGHMYIDGEGLTPSLLSYWNLLHPPLAFLSYSAFIVPFAAGIAIMNANRNKLKVSPRIYWLIDFYLLLGWCLNSILLLAGSMWGYEENWSFFWAWDPVEIASVVMWGGASIYFHSKALIDKDHPLRAFTATLGWLGVAFASFIVRSGLLSGLHSYTSSAQAIVFGVMLFASVFYVTFITWESGVDLLPDYLFEIRKSNKKVSLLTFWLIVLLITVNVIGLSIQLLNAVFSTTMTQIPYWYYIPINTVLLISLAILIPFCEIKWKDIIAPQQRMYTGLFFAISLLFFILSQMSSVLMLVAVTIISTVLLLQIQDTVKSISNRNKMRKIGRNLVHIATILLILAYLSANLFEDPVEITLTQEELTSVEKYDIKLWVDQRFNHSEKFVELRVYDAEDNLLDTFFIEHGLYKGESYTQSVYIIKSFYDLFFHIPVDSLTGATDADIGIYVYKIPNANVFRFAFFTVFTISIVAIIAALKRPVPEAPIKENGILK